MVGAWWKNSIRLIAKNNNGSIIPLFAPTWGHLHGGAIRGGYHIGG